MAFVTVDSSSATVTDGGPLQAVDSSSATVTDGGPLQVESIPIIDLRLLSQSELYSLSLCSSAAFDPCRDDDIIIPKIDCSVFNESAGSRKQTYSDLPLAPTTAASSSAIRSRASHLRDSPHPLQNPSFNNGPENSESSQIATLLKQLFGSGTQTNPTDLVPIRVDYSDSLSMPAHVPVPKLSNVGSIGLKRKRGRPRKNENGGVSEVKEGEAVKDIVVYQNVDDRDKEIMNKDGIPVDLTALGALEDPLAKN